jgi:hypothetical protein
MGAFLQGFNMKLPKLKSRLRKPGTTREKRLLVSRDYYRRQQLRNRGSAESLCNVYIFKSTDADQLDLATPFTGNLKVIVAGLAVTGLHPDIIAGLTSAWVDSTDLTNPVWNYAEISAVSLAYIVDNTFDGIVASYAKDDVWFSVDMGRPQTRLYYDLDGIAAYVLSTKSTQAGDTLSFSFVGRPLNGSSRIFFDSMGAVQRLFANLSNGRIIYQGFAGTVLLDGLPVVSNSTPMPVDGLPHKISITPDVVLTYNRIGLSTTGTAPANFPMWDFAENGVVFMAINDGWAANPTIETGGTAVNFVEGDWYEGLV